MNNLISNISFTFQEYGIAFDYREAFNKNKASKAYLQLPNTGDSVHYINDVEIENTEQESDIVGQLTEFYFDNFDDDGELGAASAKISEEVLKVQTVDFVDKDFHVAFTKDSAYVLKDSRVRSYYNKRYLFDDTDFEDFNVIITTGDDSCLIDKFDVIELAKKELGKTLSRWCTKEMQTYFDTVIKNESCVRMSRNEIRQCFDEILHDFMRDNFGENYMSIEVAGEWYSDFGCDIVGDFQGEAMDHLGETNNE
jgi:hypothetical protein